MKAVKDQVGLGGGVWVGKIPGSSPSGRKPGTLGLDPGHHQLIPTEVEKDITASNLWV